MINFNYKKILFFSFVLSLYFINANSIYAAKIYLKPSSYTVGIGEQFYVDVLIDTEGESINGVEGSVSFSPDNTFLVRIEDGKSMFNTWIKKPTIEGDTVSFSGIAPNGFYGVIDPFNSKIKLPGPVLRFVFNGIKKDTLNFSTSTFTVTRNDGVGTAESINPDHMSVTVGDYESNIILTGKNDNDVEPYIDAQVIKDPNIFDGKYVLIFQAKNKLSGIKSVLIKEGNKKWKEINSPYLLEDQNRHSIINLRAVNYSDVSILTTIDPLPYPTLPIYVVCFVCLLVAFLFFFFLKRYVHKK